TITYAKIANAIQVPSRAVTTTDSGSTVTVVDGSRHHTVTVDVGQSLGGMTQITSGLTVGEVVQLPSFFFPTQRPGNSGTSGNRPSGGQGFPGGGFGGGRSGGFGGGGR
ncbi:MAG: RND transporter, partial [Actinobacteria bacterium]|nr:RND transporter [Actinomycetota bacterium]